MKTKKKSPEELRRDRVIKMAEKILKDHEDTFAKLNSHDITFCNNTECSLKKNCLRSLDNLKTNPGKYLSVSHFEVVDGECEYFWDRRK